MLAILFEAIRSALTLLFAEEAEEEEGASAVVAIGREGSRWRLSLVAVDVDVGLEIA